MSKDFITYFCENGNVILISAKLYFSLSDDKFEQYVREECYCNSKLFSDKSSGLDLDDFDDPDFDNFFDERF